MPNSIIHETLREAARPGVKMIEKCWPRASAWE